MISSGRGRVVTMLIGWTRRLRPRRNRRVVVRKLLVRKVVVGKVVVVLVTLLLYSGNHFHVNKYFCLIKSKG